MEEPISKKFLASNNSKSLDSSLTGNKSNQTSEVDKLKKQLHMARGENFTLQQELSASMKEDAENREKIAELHKKLRELEKKQEQYKPSSPTKTRKDLKLEDVVLLEQQVRNLENKNRALEIKLKRYEEDNEIKEEKQEIIEIQQAKINELEEMLKKGSKTSRIINKCGDSNVDEKEMEFQKVMHEYDNFLRKVLSERQTLINEKNTAQKHLANLETAFNDLLQKYERAKKVVEAFKNNEEVLKNQMQDWNRMLNIFNKKYSDLKTYAEKKISEANTAIMIKDRGNIEEVAKLKAKILQSQVKINELEKHIKPNEIESVSLFTPLKNDLKKKH